MSLKISSVGDIMLGENLHHYRRGVASRYNGRFQDLIAPEVRNLLNQSDLFFGNLECSLMPDEKWKEASLDQAMYAAPVSARNVFEGLSPVIILNVANNHFAQHGESACTDTICFLKEKNIICIGRTAESCVLFQGERRIVVWGLSLVDESAGAGSYFKSTPNRVIEDIHWIDKQDRDYWVVSIHWGEEYRTLPSASQQRIAHALYEHGVDLVLGHHPHVVQPIERIENAIVCFSHGNFIFDQNFSRQTQQGLLTTIEVDHDDSVKTEAYQVFQKHFAVQKAGTVRLEDLQRRCDGQDSPLRPLIMRILMKVELIADFVNVPFSVWKYFLKRFFGKMNRWVKINNKGYHENLDRP